MNGSWKKKYIEKNELPPTNCCALQLLAQPFTILGWLLFHTSRSEIYLKEGIGFRVDFHVEFQLRSILHEAPVIIKGSH